MMKKLFLVRLKDFWYFDFFAAYNLEKLFNEHLLNVSVGVFSSPNCTYHFIEHVLCARHRADPLIELSSFKPYENHVLRVNKHVKRNPERLSRSEKLTIV